MTKDKIKIILFVVVVLLILFIIGMFVVKPAIQNYNDKMINSGIQYAIISIIQQAITCNTVPLTFENQTINMIAIECLQQQGETPEIEEEKA